MGRRMWKRRGAGGDTGDALAPHAPEHCRTADRLRHSIRRDRGDKRSTQSADGALRRVRTKLRHVAPISEQQPAAGRAQPDASADVTAEAWDLKKAAASASDTSQEVREHSVCHSIHTIRSSCGAHTCWRRHQTKTLHIKCCCRLQRSSWPQRCRRCICQCAQSAKQVGLLLVCPPCAAASLLSRLHVLPSIGL